MAKKPPSFGALKKAKPPAEPAKASSAKGKGAAPAAAEPKQVRIQTSIRLPPEMWAELNNLATRKRMEAGQRVTVHDLLIEGARHILATNGIKLPK